MKNSDVKFNFKQDMPTMSTMMKYIDINVLKECRGFDLSMIII